MIIRKNIVSVVVLCLLLLEALSAETARADNTILYGMTNDGKLVQIDVSTVSVTQVRTALPSTSGNYTGLTLYNNSLQTFVRTTSAGIDHCNIVSFGPTTGDQIDRGTLTTQCNVSLATAPDGDLQTVMSTSYPMVPFGMAIATITLQTLRADALPNPFSLTKISGSTGDGTYFDGLTYKDSATAYVLSQYQIANPPFSPNHYLKVWKLTKSNGVWNGANTWLLSTIPWDAVGLVVDPSSSTTLYTVTGFNFGAPYSPSGLYKIDMSSGSPVKTLLGTFTGYTITGLTYGPALNTISSPGGLPNPPPLRPKHMAEKAFEVIREIIFN